MKLKGIFSSLILMIAPLSAQICHIDALACNAKPGVITVKVPDTFDCNEPVNVIAPLILFYDYKQKEIQSRITLLGFEHRYEKETGLNTRVHMSGMKCNKAKHMNFNIEGSYKFKYDENIYVYPTLVMSWTRIGMTPRVHETGAYIFKNCFYAGLGIEKSFKNILLLGVRWHLSRDLDTRSFGEFGKSFVGVNNVRTTGYRISTYLHLLVVDKAVIEIQPYYGKSFERIFEEKGLKLSCSFVF